MHPTNLVQYDSARQANLKSKCPLCGHATEYLYEIDRFSPSLRIMRCQGCDLQMQETIPTDLTPLYTESYYSGDAAYSYKDERAQEKFEQYVWKARLNVISQYAPPPGEFLDVGCAFGGLALAAKKMGYNAHGIDLSAHAVQGARDRGLNATRGEITDNLFLPNSFDAVTMIEVMEHLPDPVGAIESLRRIIRPGGVLAIQTANFDGQQARTERENYHYYLPGHLYYYSRRNLTRLLNENGFGRVVFYPGVEFGLVPKLLKSRGSFKTLGDYTRWVRIAKYHLMSQIAFGNFALTSSMVLYAIRDDQG